jgi:uncharacterized protein
MAATALRLKPNPFAEPEYFRTDVTKGVTRTATGTRICTLPSDFLLGFRDAVIYECGRSYRGVMKAAGKRWGAQFIKRLDREMTAHYGSGFKDLPRGLIRVILAESFASHGYGRLHIEDIELAPEWLTIEVIDPMLPSLVRESERPVDMLTAGMVGAIFSYLSGRGLDGVQTECPSLGADRSRFLVGPAAKVGEIETWFDETDPMPTHEDVLLRIFNSTTEAESALDHAALAGA